MSLMIIRLIREKDCKHVVRYQAVSPDPENPSPVDLVYVSRRWLGPNVPSVLEMTLGPVTISPNEAASPAPK